MPKPIHVLVVDDSALMRRILSEILNADPDIEVVDTASDPLFAREKIKKLNPDVMTLDIEMPRMSGIDFLKKIMTLRPMPVVMISSLTQEGTDTTLTALEIGAVDVVGKPMDMGGAALHVLGADIIAKVKAAASSRMQERRTPEPPLVSNAAPMRSFLPERLIAIGASTGGVPIINAILPSFPANMPPVLIVQHMPESFTARFAARLNAECRMKICEAVDGQEVQAGHAYLAPGGQQMRLIRSGARRLLRVSPDEKVNGFAPSVDVLFDSVAEVEKKNAIGVILTGMGRDGASGMVNLRQSGAFTIGQDEATSVVYGMPKVAFDMGGVDLQLPGQKIAHEIFTRCTRNTALTA